MPDAGSLTILLETLNYLYFKYYLVSYLNFVLKTDIDFFNLCTPNENLMEKYKFFEIYENFKKSCSNISHSLAFLSELGTFFVQNEAPNYWDSNIPILQQQESKFSSNTRIGSHKFDVIFALLQKDRMNVLETVVI